MTCFDEPICVCAPSDYDGIYIGLGKSGFALHHVCAINVLFGLQNLNYDLNSINSVAM